MGMWDINNMSNGDVDMEIRNSFTNGYELSLWNSILEIDPTLDQAVIKPIVINRHCGNGYYSWDGLLDDLEDIVGYDRASEILNNC